MVSLSVVVLSNKETVLPGAAPGDLPRLPFITCKVVLR